MQLFVFILYGNLRRMHQCFAPYAALCRRVLACCGLICCFGIAGAAGADASSDAAAMEIFYQIPSSIFDSTYYPVNEEEKELILEKGYSSNWVLTDNSKNVLHFASLSEDPNSVTVQVYRSATGGVVAVVAATPDACAAELWSFEDNGVVQPYEPGPPEPSVNDFFAIPVKLSPEITPTYRLCLSGDTLEAKIFFWDTSGLVALTPTRKVLYTWNGTLFQKSVIPVSGTGTPGHNATQPE